MSFWVNRDCILRQIFACPNDKKNGKKIVFSEILDRGNLDSLVPIAGRKKKKSKSKTENGKGKYSTY